MSRVFFRLPAFLAPCLLAACGLFSSAPEPEPELPAATTTTPAPAIPATPTTTTPAATPDIPPPAPGLVPADWNDLPGWQTDTLGQAWGAFLRSCPLIARRFARPALCADAAAVDAQDEAALRRFLVLHFMPWRLADEPQGGLVTGYYEPLIEACARKSRACAVPILGVPSNLVPLDWPAGQAQSWPLRGRRLQSGKIVSPYWSRAQIRVRVEAGRWPGKVLLWAKDPVDFFFLQVQGSGKALLPDGRRLRLSYADKNGHPYRSIGKWLVDKGELRLDQASKEGIARWARAHPERLNELLDVNPSYVFFTVEPDTATHPEDSGPKGAAGVPLTPLRSIAVDPRRIPLGAFVWLSTSWPNDESRPLDRLVVAQDTGSAIAGASRADFFWGFGDAAGDEAGKMKQPGALWVLLPLPASE
ncbi:MAG: MltA domain-containing protein [Zoogloeaceae bacterium]|jgi:membrane-bound lytic murein transglycosylase A|nr:MltA domain-containing protein [Zoogloeaceae bacterium]